MKLKTFLTGILMNLILLPGISQTTKMTREEYISKYKDLAVEEMSRTGIPASITLAQALLESGNGNSRLAVKGNNHFGIKCHDWDGRKLRHDDDARRECFRRYKSAEESYRDHSDFLTTKSRYASLFQLDPTDYAGWAKGLKKAGYATSPSYAGSLINIIEEYKLYQLDQGVDIDVNSLHYADITNGKTPVEQSPGIRKIYENNRIKYIIVKTGDTFSSLTAELNLLPWQLSKYNELSDNQQLYEGQVLYIQPKRNNAEAGKKTHIVGNGETMYAIAQKYGIRLDKLYSRNRMEKGSEPGQGAALNLRGPARERKLQVPDLANDEAQDEVEMKFEFDEE